MWIVNKTVSRPKIISRIYIFNVYAKMAICGGYLCIDNPHRTFSYMQAERCCIASPAENNAALLLDKIFQFLFPFKTRRLFRSLVRLLEMNAIVCFACLLVITSFGFGTA